MIAVKISMALKLDLIVIFLNSLSLIYAKQKVPQSAKHCLQIPSNAPLFFPLIRVPWEMPSFLCAQSVLNIFGIFTSSRGKIENDFFFNDPGNQNTAESSFQQLFSFFFWNKRKAGLSNLIDTRRTNPNYRGKKDKNYCQRKLKKL